MPAHLPDLPFVRTVLPNGLTLVTHEDRKAPIVCVNVWYHVGSKNERPGRTGLAHLFEHLMFNGSEHFNDDFFQAFEPIGATDQNGTTSPDRTNYFQNVPTGAVDVALWMESDRMGHLLGAVDQAKLDEQRGVVQNEKRQYENQPYGRVHEFLAPRLYPAGHPYSWTVIGSMADLDATSLEDVHAWFRAYYGAANATLVVAGDIDHDTAHRKVAAYFGAIPAGPPIERMAAWVAKRSGTQRARLEDRVPQARVYRTWNVAERGTADADALDLVTDVLAQGRMSRLYRRLVMDAQAATDVHAYLDAGELGSTLWIEASARDGVPLATVERLLDEELQRFLAEGPTAAEVQRVRTQHHARFLRGIERIGGFGGKSDVLAESEVFGGAPDAWRPRLERLLQLEAATLRDAAGRWLADGDFVLEVAPFSDGTTATATVDRSALPIPAPQPAPRFPALERATLANGVRVVLARRPTIPQVRVDVLLDSGFAADAAAAPGTNSLMMAMLDEGTSGRSSLEIGELLASLGATLRTRSSLDSSTVSLEALTEHLGPSLDLLAEVLLDPVFPEADLERLRQHRLAEIRQEQAETMSLAWRLFPALLYGPGHPYAVPYTGTGTLAAMTALTRDDLVAFHRRWLRPERATLVVTGATTLDAIVPELERRFGHWAAGDGVPKSIPVVAAPAHGTIYLVDRPGSIQSTIAACRIAPPRADADDVPIEVMNGILGGTFTSRLNMNLREDKHWTYGAHSSVLDARGPRPFVASVQVQGDQTANAIREMQGEFRGILGSRPVTADELQKAKASLTLTLPGTWETMAAIARSIREIVAFGLDDRHFDRYPDQVNAVGAADVVRAAGRIVAPDATTWLVVGDAAAVEGELQALGLGEVIRLPSTE